MAQVWQHNNTQFNLTKRESSTFLYRIGGLEFEEPNANEMLAKLHASVSTWKHMEHMAT